MGGGARGAKGYRALDVGWAILFSRAGLLTDLHTKVDFPVQAMAWRRSPLFSCAISLTVCLETKGYGIQENLSCSSEHISQLTICHQLAKTH